MKINTKVIHWRYAHQDIVGRGVGGAAAYHIFAWVNFLGFQNKYDGVQMHDKCENSGP